MFIGFVKFEIKQWFAAYQDQVCAWFSLAWLPTEAARKLFLYHFLKETALSLSFSGFSNLFNAAERLFCILSFGVLYKRLWNTNKQPSIAFKEYYRVYTYFHLITPIDQGERSYYIKPRPNDRNMPTQHIATMLGATCCVRLATVLRCVATCWVLFEHGQIWANNTQHIATRWPNASNILRPTMLRHVVSACCDRLAGALNIFLLSMEINGVRAECKAEFNLSLIHILFCCGTKASWIFKTRPKVIVVKSKLCLNFNHDSISS